MKKNLVTGMGIMCALLSGSGFYAYAALNDTVSVNPANVQSQPTPCIATQGLSPQASAVITPEAISAAAPSIAAAIATMQQHMMQAQQASAQPIAQVQPTTQPVAQIVQPVAQAIVPLTPQSIAQPAPVAQAVGSTPAQPVIQVAAQTAQQNNISAQIAEYKNVTNSVIEAIVTENVADMTGLINKLNKATEIGINFAKETAVKEPSGARLLGFLVDNVENIRKNSLEDIETNWHHGGEYTKAGINFDNFAQTSHVMSANDSVLHPITAILALNEYQKTQDPTYLEQAQSELEEVMEHINHVN